MNKILIVLLIKTCISIHKISDFSTGLYGMKYEEGFNFKLRPL